MRQPDGHGYNGLTQPATSATQTSGGTVNARGAINFYQTEGRGATRPHESATLKHLIASSEAFNQKSRSQLLKQVRSASGNNASIYSGLSRASEQRTSKLRHKEAQRATEYRGLIRSKMAESTKISSSTALIKNSKQLDMRKRSNAKL